MSREQARQFGHVVEDVEFYREQGYLVVKDAVDPVTLSRLRQSIAEIVAAGFDEALVTRVVRMIDRAEYKRRQAAPGLKVTSRAFGFGRRMPIAQRYEPLKPEHGELGEVKK